MQTRGLCIDAGAELNDIGLELPRTSFKIAIDGGDPFLKSAGDLAHLGVERGNVLAAGIG